MMDFGEDLAGLSPEQRELLALLLQEQGVALETSGVTARKQPGEDAPLSFSQARLWFLDQLEPGSPMYNMPAAARLHGSLSEPVLQASLDEIAARHEVLRTVFIRGSDGEPVQHILPQPHVPVVSVDLSALPAARQEEELVRLASAEVQRPFDLARGPLIRVMLLVFSGQDYLLLLNMHHIVTDGWSMGVFIRELGAVYAAFAAGHPSPLPPLPLQYGDYALWQRDVLKGQALEDQLAYWREALQDIPAVLDLPLDRPRPAVQSHRGATLDFVIPARTQTAMNQLAQAEGATLFMALLSAFQVFLYRYSRQTDVCVGTPIANRTRGELEGLIGFFTNTLVIRGQLAPDMPYRQFLRRIREVTLAAYEHQDVPFEQVVEAVHPERTMSYSPLFQVMFALQNVPQQVAQLPGITLSPATFPSVTARFDLSFNLGERPDGIAGSVEYNSDLFDRGTIERMVRNLETLLEAAAADPDQAVGKLPVITQAERELVTETWNRTEVPFPDSTTIHAMIEEWAERTPDSTAVEYVELTADSTRTTGLSYRQLHDRANQLAHRLRALGVGPDTLVGLSVTRSLDMIVGILGILRAGGAYVPLDASYPADRLAFMIADSGIKLLVTEASLVNRLPLTAEGIPTDLHVLCLDADWDEIARYPASNPEANVGPENLAYCIFTSGSTGRPKGTPIRHRGLCSLASAAGPDFGMAPGKRMLQFAAFSFDASVWETTMTLCHGATLVLAPQDTLSSGPELLRLLAEARITNVVLPPALAAVLEPVPLPDLGLVISGGERVTNQMVQRWGPGRRFFNGYGPTEITICATFSECDPSKEWPFGGPPIGRPVANLRCYVVDHNLQVQPVGVPGELVIGGVGVSTGYLNRPELTAERFIPELPAPEAWAGEARPGPIKGPLYRTGDLVRWLPHGELEFMGRIDDQVKVRGFRIELGEIEAVLREHPGVKDAVVTARGDMLVGYYIARTGDSGEETVPVTSTALRSHLRQHLPEYMVPAIFMPMEAFPISPANKVDRRLLPAPDRSHHEAGSEYIAPRTPTEDVLASIWAQLLNQPRIGAHDSFFELGGHSLSATQLVSRVRDAFGVEMPLRSLFEAPALSALAERIDRMRAEAADSVAPQITAVARHPDDDGRVRLPLSFAQQRLWFLDQLEPGGSLYNIPSAVRLTGRLDLPALRRTLDALAARHEALRTTFETVDGKAVQVISPRHSLDLDILDLSDQPDQQEAAIMRVAVAEAQKPFDLANGPLTRVALLRLADDDYTLLITMHHIISDGWSTGVINREFAELYAAFAAGETAPSFPPLPLQYADYAIWQRSWLGSPADETSAQHRQLEYWRKQLGGAPALLELPTDRPRPAVESHRGAGIEFELPTELVEGLRRISREEGATLFMTLMAAFQTLLSRLSSQTDISVGTPVANRTRGELESIVGFFVNTLVMRSDLSDRPTFRELVRQVRGTALEAYAHQDVPFEKLVDGLNVARDMSHSPLFQAMFVLQNTPSAAVHLPGLTLAPVPVHAGTTPFDLTLVLVESGEGLTGWLEYATDLFDPQTANDFIRYFRNLLRGLITEPDKRVTRVPILSREEQRNLIENWNDTACSVSHLCLHEAFERQVQRTPEGLALIDTGDGNGRPRRELTFAELDRIATALAVELQRLGVGREEIVPISVEKSAEQVIGLLGVLKAGGAYLPIDPTFPAERIEFLVADAGARVLLTQSHLRDRFQATAARHVICLDDLDGLILGAGAARPVNRATPERLAYVIYTSGSTGRPKGVMIGHLGAVSLAEDYVRRFDLGPGRRVLQFTSFSFDVSVVEMFSALVSGAALIIAPREFLTEPAGLMKLFVEERVDYTWVPPAMLMTLPSPTPVYPRLLETGGEACPPDLAARWTPGRRFFNGYGPTEMTIAPTAHEIVSLEAERHNVSIGRPVANYQAYVLDGEMQPVPPNVTGELYLSGLGTARGYHRRPELTAERFVPNPFAMKPGQDAADLPVHISTRLYRTGDLARFRRNGEIEYLGRIDNQVKVHGYRIELGEIEAVLANHPGVKECAVVARDEGPGGTGKRLIAYLAPAIQPPPSVAELRSFLLTALPDYMVPAVFVTLPSLPVNTNGKVDRRALPAPSEAERTGTGREFLAPSTPAEQTLAEIWSQVLGVPRVGVNDSFFELGGDSILSIQVIARANQAGLHLTPKQLFQSPTIAALAAVAGTVTAPAAEQGPIEGPVELTPIQRWFFELPLANRNHWNQSIMLTVRRRLESASLQAAILALIEHHDALRMRFTETEAGWTAFNPLPASDDPAPFEHVDLSGADAGAFSSAVESHAANVQRTLDIARGPLIRAVYYDAGPDRPGRLLLVIHHLGIDGVSWRVLMEDLQNGYAQHMQGMAIRLAPKTTSFKAWSEKLTAHAKSDAVANELDGWLGRVSGWVAPLPVDQAAAAGENTESSTAQVGGSLTAEETDALLTEAGAAYNTETPDLLLTALVQTMEKWTGTPSVYVHLEGHGREELGEAIDVSRTVGWFTTLYPVRLDLPWGAGPGEAIVAVKESLRSVPNHGLGYGLLRYLAGPESSEALASQPSPELTFNYLGQFDQVLAAGTGTGGTPGAAAASPFGPARESAGRDRAAENERRHLLDVTAIVAGGRMNVSWTYSRALHSESTVQQLADWYLEALRGLIAHCKSPEAGSYTPSDFPLAELDQKQLDKVLKKVKTR